jgi:hypothetical protein
MPRVVKPGSKSARDPIAEMIAASRPEIYWGEWLRYRMNFVGYKRQEDFRRAVGCTRSRLYDWLNSEKPPNWIYKGFDARLASALRTDPHMLFFGWRTTLPDEAPLLENVKSYDMTEVQNLRDRLDLIVALLPVDRLRRLVDAARSEAAGLDAEIMSALDRRARKNKK